MLAGNVILKRKPKYFQKTRSTNKRDDICELLLLALEGPNASGSRVEEASRVCLFIPSVGGVPTVKLFIYIAPNRKRYLRLVNVSCIITKAIDLSPPTENTTFCNTMTEINRCYYL